MHPAKCECGLCNFLQDGYHTYFAVHSVLVSEEMWEENCLKRKTKKRPKR